MDYLPSQLPPSCLYHDGEAADQLQWSLAPLDFSSDLFASQNLSSDPFDTTLSPEQLSALIAAYESSWNSTSADADPSFLPTMHQPDWTNPSSNISPPSIDDSYNLLGQPSLVPLMTSSTTYRNGFGELVPMTECHPFDSPTVYDSGSSPLPIPSSSSGSPSESRSSFMYSMSQPMLAAHQHWNFPAKSSEASSTSKASHSSLSKCNASEQLPIKKHCCQICGRAFQRQTTLTQHLITHTGERPYACPISGCGKAFTTASNAKRHSKTHYRISSGYQQNSSPPGGY